MGPPGAGNGPKMWPRGPAFERRSIVQIRPMAARLVAKIHFEKIPRAMYFWSQVFKPGSNGGATNGGGTCPVKVQEGENWPPLTGSRRMGADNPRRNSSCVSCENVRKSSAFRFCETLAKNVCIVNCEQVRPEFPPKVSARPWVHTHQR